MQVQQFRPVVIAANAGACGVCTVRRQSVCSAIEDADLARLAEASTTRLLAKGQSFIEEGAPSTDFFNVTAGTVKLYKLLPDGRQQITGFAQTGHFLGLAVSHTYAFSAEALEPVQLCRFSRPKLRAMLDDFPALEKRLLETACSELAAAQDQMLLLGRKTAKERVASFLLSRVKDGSQCCQFNNRIHLPMNRLDIADYLGLTIETVSRTLTMFKRARRIEIPSGSEIIVLDYAWLQQLAAGLY